MGVPWQVMRQVLQRQVSSMDHSLMWGVCLFGFDYGMVEVNKQRWRVIAWMPIQGHQSCLDINVVVIVHTSCPVSV